MRNESFTDDDTNEVETDEFLKVCFFNRFTYKFDRYVIYIEFMLSLYFRYVKHLKIDLHEDYNFHSFYLIHLNYQKFYRPIKATYIVD